VVSSIADIAIASTMASCGIAMARLPLLVLGGTLVLAGVFAVIVDIIKVPIFRRLRIA
jgi:H+-transporting ATPase